MKKIQILICFFILFTFSFSFAFADEEIDIISRQEWWADENLRYLSSPEWKSITKKWEETPQVTLTEAQKNAQAKAKEKQENIAKYFSLHFPDESKVVEKITSENGEELAWPIQRTQYVKGIVIHHTDTNYEGSAESVRKIQRFHSISRAWGDIGYNYLIGYDGEIYEWRAGWDYAVWAHALYNNFSTVSISLIWEYDEKWITDVQYQSLSKLVLFLSKKYGIDLNKKVKFHRECTWKNCIEPIMSFESYPIIGHRDVAATTCPWDDLYAQIMQVLKENQEKTRGLEPIANKSTDGSLVAFALTSGKKQFEKYKKSIQGKDENDLLELLASLEEKLWKNKETKENQKNLILLKQAILEHFQEKEKTTEKPQKSFDDTQSIRVKLSYTGTWITIKDGKKSYTFTANDHTLEIAGRKIKKLEIHPKSGNYLEISSWNRIPEWDTQKKYNDNIFKWSLIISVVNGQIQVINKLKMSDYLKWLWEVSNGDEKEKIKSIIIAARTYARYYLTQDKKFDTDEYDGSDSPDEFQRYLWYGYEKRSPNVVKIVDDTKDMIITYKDTVIKPWYFHSSNGVTRSYKEYCILNTKDESTCKKNSELYPYLAARKDIGSSWKSFAGHGVWISGEWATFFAKKWWSAQMIISYYLKWTKVNLKWS